MELIEKMRAGAIDKKTLSGVSDSINCLFGELAKTWSQRYGSGSVLIQDDSGERFTITFDAKSSKILITLGEDPSRIITQNIVDTSNARKNIAIDYGLRALEKELEKHVIHRHDALSKMVEES